MTIKCNFVSLPNALGLGKISKVSRTKQVIRQMFRLIALRRRKRYDHTMIQTIFIHKNVSTCDFLRFDANEEGNFEAQKLEKS